MIIVCRASVLWENKFEGELNYGAGCPFLVTKNRRGVLNGVKYCILIKIKSNKTC